MFKNKTRLGNNFHFKDQIPKDQICGNGTVQFTFFLIMRLNITIITSCDSLILIFVT